MTTIFYDETNNFCKLIKVKDTYVLLMKTNDNQWVAQKPYTADLRGLIASLTLALDVLAGKIQLDKVLAQEINNELTKLNNIKTIDYRSK